MHNLCHAKSLNVFAILLAYLISATALQLNVCEGIGQKFERMIHERIIIFKEKPSFSKPLRNHKEHHYYRLSKEI